MGKAIVATIGIIILLLLGIRYLDNRNQGTSFALRQANSVQGTSAIALGPQGKTASPPPVQVTPPPSSFLGSNGETLILKNNRVTLAANQIASKAKFFNTTLPDGKTVYFFIVKDASGKYRAAANACQVCFKTRKGYHQEDNEMVCNNCGNRYPLERIATEKGGCNPGPINPDLKVKDGKLEIALAQLEQVADLF